MITTILTLYRRPHLLKKQIEYIRKQSVKSKIWVWHNYHKDSKDYDFNNLDVDTVIRSDYNYKFFARFALANLVETKYVSILDDDTFPGNNWYKNCLDTESKVGCNISGGVGIILQDKNYKNRLREGWPTKNNSIIKVDFVGHSWFFSQNISKYFWYEAPYRITGEDMHFSCMAQKYGDIPTVCPPQHTKDIISSIYPELGVDDTTKSVIDHKSFFRDRNKCLNSLLSNGWQTINNVYS